MTNWTHVNSIDLVIMIEMGCLTSTQRQEVEQELRGRKFRKWGNK